MAEKEIPMLARRLRDMREAAGLSQQELAVKAGLSVSVVSQIEQGKKADPRMSTVVALASALGVDVGSLAVSASPDAPGRSGRKKKSP
jgi:transcriptional regulator with XRE-family HTH domain